MTTSDRDKQIADAKVSVGVYIAKRKQARKERLERGVDLGELENIHIDSDLEQPADEIRRDV